MPVLVVALVLTWYLHWGWRYWYINHTPGTLHDDGAVAIATDHTTYLGDEPLAITVTNHLPVPIYTQITPNHPAHELGIKCSIDLSAEVLDHAGHWVQPTYWLGVGCEPGCPGVPVPPPPRQVLALAPGTSYTQHWHPSRSAPTTQPGTYRIVFRYSTDPAAAKLTRVGMVDMPQGGTPEALELATITSLMVRVVDDGLRPAPTACVGV